MYMSSYMRNLLPRHKKTRLHCGLFIVPYSMMTSPNSFQCLNRSVTWGKVKQEEKIVFKSSGRRKKHLEKKLSAGVEEAKKHRGLNILLLQTFCCCKHFALVVSVFIVDDFCCWWWRWRWWSKLMVITMMVIMLPAWALTNHCREGMRWWKAE